MDMADAQSVGCTGISCGRRIDGADDGVDVERIGFLKDQLAVATPRLARSVGIDFDTVAFRIVEVNRFADVMIGGAADGHTILRRMQNPARQIRACRHQERGVIKAGVGWIVG